MGNAMTSHGHYEINDRAERGAETSHGFPTRVAAGVVILVALVFVDATPRMVPDAIVNAQPITKKAAPSACGADSAAQKLAFLIGNSA